MCVSVGVCGGSKTLYSVFHWYSQESSNILENISTFDMLPLSKSI